MGKNQKRDKIKPERSITENKRKVNKLEKIA